MLKRLEQLSYKERLCHFGIFGLKRRQTIGFVIYKIMHNVDQMEKLFPPSQSTGTRNWILEESGQTKESIFYTLHN